MSTSAKINIKDLPQALQIEDGDLLIVEKNDGTYTLDYADLILETNKTAITTQVDSNTTAIADLSTSTDTKISDLSAQVYADIKKVYIGRVTVSIDSGAQNSTFLSPRPTTEVPALTIEDFIITPANAAACKYPGYVTYVENQEDGLGYFTVTSNLTRSMYTVTVSSDAPSYVTSTLTSTVTSSTTLTNKISGYTVQDLINNLQVINDNSNITGSSNTYTVDVVTESSTVESLLEYPQYHVTVIKSY